METQAYVGKLIYEGGQFRTTSRNLEAVLARVYKALGETSPEYGSVIVKIIELDVMTEKDETIEEYLFEYRNSRWCMVDWIV